MPMHLHDAPYGPVLDKLAGENRALHVHTLAVVDGVFLPRLLDRPV